MQPLDIKAAKAVKANVGKKAGFSVMGFLATPRSLQKGGFSRAFFLSKMASKWLNMLNIWF